MQCVESTSSQLQRAAADIAGYLAGLLCDLYQTDITILPTTPKTTFTTNVATFTGYAQGVVTWDTPTQADDGTIEVVGIFAKFQPTDAVTPNMIYGCYFTEAGAPHDWVFAGRFDTAPLPMDTALRQITLTIRYRPATNTIVAYVS